jgi:transient receptor potential cation channel subfamily M protein 2
MIQRSGDLNVILRTLVGDYMYKLYFNSLKEEHAYRVKNGLTSKSSEAESDDIIQLTTERNLTADDYIMRDLFIWSILMNRIEMAKVFLSHMKYRICPALIATKILKEYYKKAQYGDLKDSYLESKKYFEQYAIDCLDKCNENNGDTACEIVLQRNDLYGYVTCLLVYLKFFLKLKTNLINLKVAANADDELFIARPACVQVMYNVWYDKLSPEQTRIQDRLALLIGFISLGLAAPPFVTYREIKQVRISYYKIDYSYHVIFKLYR